jgi:hypothetical protein
LIKVAVVMEVDKMQGEHDAKHDQHSMAEGGFDDQSYLNQLTTERRMLDPSLTVAAQLLDREIARVQSKQDSDRFIELHQDKPMKMCVKVRVPVKEFPKFNFVGKILGPKGNSLKRIQEETGTRIAVFGRGSMRDKHKEEELRREGGKYAHLNDDLHVSVEVYAHPVDCYGRLSHALYKLRQHLVPDYNDDISQSQVQELRYLNGETGCPVTRGRGTAAVSEFHGPSRGSRGSSGSYRGGYVAVGPVPSFGRGTVFPSQGTSIRPPAVGPIPATNFNESNSLRQW